MFGNHQADITFLFLAFVGCCDDLDAMQCVKITGFLVVDIGNIAQGVIRVRMGWLHRSCAAFKFFLYTLAGSLLMLVALIYLYYKSGGSFDIQAWHDLPLPMTAQSLLFFAFFAAFAVKVPMWPAVPMIIKSRLLFPKGGPAPGRRLS